MSNLGKFKCQSFNYKIVSYFKRTFLNLLNILLLLKKLNFAAAYPSICLHLQTIRDEIPRSPTGYFNIHGQWYRR